MKIVKLTKEELLERMNEFWQETDEKPYIEPKFTIVCPFCSSEMVFKHANYFSRGYPNNVGYNYRCDVAYKCLNCGYVATFGVAISESHYKKVLKKGEKFIEWWQC